MIKKTNLLNFLIALVSISQSCKAQEITFYNAVIQQVNNYPLEDIVERCQTDYNYTQQDMELLEQELKRYLILCILYKNIAMYSKDVDNLWHSFILFTQQYAHFCTSIAGRFIHHAPTTLKEKQDTSLKKRNENIQAFNRFVELYELTFNQPLHDIWYLDSAEAS